MSLPFSYIGELSSGEPRRSSFPQANLGSLTVAVLPFAILLQRFPIAKALSLIIFLWGVTVILTVVVKDYKGLIVQRVFLGLLESCVSPGFVLVTGMWYKKVRLGGEGLFSGTEFR